MAKYSEDFTVATWDKNGGSCSATANSTIAPEGNMTARNHHRSDRDADHSTASCQLVPAHTGSICRTNPRSK